jgi:hypothetical protein
MAIATSKILILAREPLAAALLGLLVELDAYEPAFAQPGETAEEAVRRVRPLLIILLDASVDAAGSDVFYARAKDIPVVLFGSPGTGEHVRALAGARALPWFMMPAERAIVSRIVRDVVASTGNRSDRDRRRPSSRRGSNGSLIYCDREGHEWQVYDRRSRERRSPEERTGEYRTFVNAAGEEWHYSLGDAEVGEVSPAALERQLAHAVRI